MAPDDLASVSEGGQAEFNRSACTGSESRGEIVDCSAGWRRRASTRGTILSAHVPQMLRHDGSDSKRPRPARHARPARPVAVARSVRPGGALRAPEPQGRARSWTSLGAVERRGLQRERAVQRSELCARIARPRRTRPRGRRPSRWSRRLERARIEVRTAERAPAPRATTAPERARNVCQSITGG